MPADRATMGVCSPYETLPERLRRIWMQRGPQALLLAAGETIARPLVRLRRRLVFTARLDRPFEPSVWTSGERLFIVGRDELGSLSPDLLMALQTDDQQADFEGISSGNRVFILADKDSWLHRGYLRLTPPGEHDRKAVFFGELQNLPEIRSCNTSSHARGRGLYRRVINEQFRYLQSLGYTRAAMYIMAENTPSIKGATAAGYELCRRLDDWVIFNRFVVQRVHEGGSVHWRFFVQ